MSLILGIAEVGARKRAAARGELILRVSSKRKICNAGARKLLLLVKAPKRILASSLLPVLIGGRFLHGL